MAIFHMHVKAISRTSHTTVGALAYRSGTLLKDERTGEVHNYRQKSVAHVELIVPENSPQWAVDLKELISKDREKGVQAFSDIMEKAEKRFDSRVYREVEFALPCELNDEKNIALAQQFAQDYLARRGILSLINNHIDVDKETGEKKPHIHAMLCTRTLEKEGLGFKNRAWDSRGFLQDLRKELCEETNFHLKMDGHKARVDHRSYAERGIDLLPQPKMRSGVVEMEKKTGFQSRMDSPEAFFYRFKTRVGQDWQEKKLQNLFKVMTQPAVIVEAVASKQSTFVWRDITEEVSKRVPDQQMAAQVCERIYRSSSLVQVGDHRFFEGTSEEKSVPVYTSRETLNRESELGRLGERLSHRRGHGSELEAFEDRVSAADAQLKKEHGTGFSKDQKAALEHICSSADLSCVVGYAGSGKTTVLGVAHDIWKDSGYKVYGLAPTGRAADNLQESGITSSQTLHKFLKSFEAGRSQYDANSVLVLDEGGMVPVHLMKQFLHAVNHLNVKTVIVGDGNQLQPIEAGAAFRSVLHSTAPVSLETVVRQKQDWQKEASHDFGAGRSRDALSLYDHHGHIHLKGSLPSLSVLEGQLKDKAPEIRDQGIVDLYRLRETAKVLKGVAFGQMLDDVERVTGKRDWRGVFAHEDFKERFGGWKALEKSCRGVLSDHGLDPKASTYKMLGRHGVPRDQAQPLHDIRAGARSEMLQRFQSDIHERKGLVGGDEKTLMLAYGRQDVRALNEGARAFLQKEGIVSKKEFVHQVSRPLTDSFGRQKEETSERAFAKGDLVLFLKNDRGLEVRNGHRGRITSIDDRKTQVELLGDSPRVVSFSPNLYNALDYGWATTIHKSQGATVDKTLYLATPSDTRNLAYVAMTRHREDVQVFASKEEFGSTKTMVAHLSQASEKTLAQDYLQGRDPQIQERGSLWTELSRGFEGLKNFGQALTRDLKDLRDPHSVASLRATPASQVAVSLCSKVLEVWQVRDSNQKNQFEKDLLSLVKTVERANPQALHLFREAYPDQQKLLSSIQEKSPLQEREENEPLQKTSGMRVSKSDSRDPIEGAFYERREGRRGGDLLERRAASEDRSLETSILGSESIVSKQDSKEMSEGIPVVEAGSDIKGKADDVDLKAEVSKSPALRERIDFKVLDSELALRADTITKSLLGEPNKSLSSAREYRYGSKGSLSVTVSGRNSGRWYDFEKGEGGGLFNLIQNNKGGSFKDALQVANAFIGGRATVLNSSPQKFQKEANSEASLSEAQVKVGKIEWANKISHKSTRLTNLAENYLTSRGLYESPGPSIRSGEAKDPETGKMYPALQAFAKDAEGKVTGGQHILLDPETGNKADVSVKKRSFGVIKGSFVEVQKDTKNTGRTFIAEGVETALSLKQSGIEGKIVATLGVHNFKNYAPQESEKTIVLCGDNDGKDSKSATILQECQKNMIELGKEVFRVVPPTQGDDFNDVLQNSGSQVVRSILQEAEKDLSSSAQYVKHSASSAQKEEETFKKEAKAVEQKYLDSRDWYQEIKKMRSGIDFEKVAESLLEKTQDPVYAGSAKEQIHEMLNVAASERHFSKYVSEIQNFNEDLFKNLKSLGIDFKELNQVSDQNKLVLSDRARQDLVSTGESRPTSSLVTRLHSQLDFLEGRSGGYASQSRVIQSTQEVCAALEGVQNRPDKAEILKELQERYPKSFEKLEEIGRTQENLQEDVNRAFGRTQNQTQERSQGFDMGL